MSLQSQSTIWAPASPHALPNRIAARVGRHPTLAFLAVFVVAMALAWLNRFIQDDAFISFRYSWNFAHGMGLTFNPEGFDPAPVEGYTNFLWTVIMAAPIKLGFDIIIAAQIIGMVCFAASLIGLYKLAQTLLGNKVDALTAVLIAGTNYTFLTYATGGLETQLVAALLIWTFYVACRLDAPERWTVWRVLLLSLLAGLAFLTRMDAAIFLAIIGGMVGLRWLIAPIPVGRKIGLAIAAAIPAGGMIGAWLYWKIGYYGDIFPNTYYVKLSDDAVALQTFLRGIYFVGKFAIEYMLLPFVVILIARFSKIVTTLPMLTLVGIIAIWFLYIIRTGGDFMEFRFMVTAIPLLAIVIAAGLRHTAWLKGWLLLVLIGASAFHGGTFQRSGGIESISELHGHVMEAPDNWRKIGEAYHRYFAELEPQPSLALGAAGAMPYYSRLPIIDMLGLTDAHVARNGELYSTRPGHMRAGNHQYLIDRKTTFYSGVTKGFRKQDNPAKHCSIPPYDQYFQLLSPLTDQFPENFRFIVMPIDDEWMFPVLYMHPEPAVDEAIARHGLQTCQVVY